MRTRFGKEKVLGLGRRLEQLLDAGKRSRGSHDTGFDGIAGAFEIVPCKMLNVRPKNEVGVAFPRFELVFLSRCHGPRDHLKHIFRGAATTVLKANGDCKNALGAELACCDCWDLCDKTAVGEATRSDFDGLEQAWKSATGTNCVNQRALRENDRVKSRQVRGDYGHWNFQVFELTRVKNAIHQVGQPMITRKAEARNAPTGDVAELKVAAGGQYLGERRAACVSRAEDASNARTCNVGDGNVILFKDLQHAKMREASRESATESQADAAPWRCGRHWHVAADWDTRVHDSEDALGLRTGQWEARP